MTEPGIDHAEQQVASHLVARQGAAHRASPTRVSSGRQRADVVRRGVLVGRLFRWIGVNGALLALPIVALIGYGLVLPADLRLLRLVKIRECAGTDSVLNRAAGAVPPLSARRQYE